MIILLIPLSNDSSIDFPKTSSKTPVGKNLKNQTTNCSRYAFRDFKGFLSKLLYRISLRPQLEISLRMPSGITPEFPPMVCLVILSNIYQGSLQRFFQVFFLKFFQTCLRIFKVEICWGTLGKFLIDFLEILRNFFSNSWETVDKKA